MTVLRSVLGSAIGRALYRPTDLGAVGKAAPRNVPPVAAFTVSTSELVATFTDASSDPDGVIVAWSWDFGDGTTSTERHPVHTYAASGDYTVTLTVTDDRGGRSSYTLGLSLNLSPAASFTVLADFQDITLTSTSVDPDGTVVAWDWDLGDGTIANGPTVSHTYAESGTYTVTLTVTDDGATASTSGSVTVESWQDVVAGLFAGGEPGVWLDPSDLSTMYQDAAGTTPVTGVEQPVGLILDRRLGLERGPELRAGFVAASNGSPPAPATYNTDTGVGTAARTNGNNLSRVQFTGLATGGWYRIEVSNTGPSPLSVRQGDITVVLGSISSGQTRTFYVNATSENISIVPDVNGTIIAFIVHSLSAVPGNHVYQAAAASRPTLREDDNGHLYLSFDGTDDCLLTNEIDLTSTDKVAMVAGVTKLSDSATGLVCELGHRSDNTDGAFALFSPSGSGGNKVSFWVRGEGVMLRLSVTTGFNAPATGVLTGLADLAEGPVALRINGANVLSRADSLGGNFTRKVLYIGSRQGKVNRFNGRIYGLIVRGTETTETQVSAMERWAADRMGITLTGA